MTDPAIDALTRRIEELGTELERVRTEVASHAMTNSADDATTPAPLVSVPAESDSEAITTHAPTGESVSRRHALRTAGVVAAGALAGGIATVATAGPAAALGPGSFDSNTGVAAVGASNSSTGSGVDASAASGIAVSGISTSGTGVWGTTAGPLGNAGVRGDGAITGVWGTTSGTSLSTAAVRGDSSDTTAGFGGRFNGAYGVIASGSMGAVVVAGPGGAAPSTRTGESFLIGTLSRDGNGNLWVCVVSGTPGQWRMIAGPASAGAFNSIQPGRVYDSRAGAPPPQGPLPSGQNRTISVADRRDGSGTSIQSDFVPPGTIAVFANITVTGTSGTGYLSVNPGGNTAADSSVINWSTNGQTIANGVALRIDTATRTLTVVTGGPGSTDFLIDITGYWL